MHVLQRYQSKHPFLDVGSVDEALPLEASPYLSILNDTEGHPLDVTTVGRRPGRERSGGSGDRQEREMPFGPKQLREPVWRRGCRAGASQRVSEG